MFDAINNLRPLFLAVGAAGFFSLLLALAAHIGSDYSARVKVYRIKPLEDWRDR